MGVIQLDELESRGIFISTPLKKVYPSGVPFFAASYCETVAAVTESVDPGDVRASFGREVLVKLDQNGVAPLA